MSSSLGRDLLMEIFHQILIKESYGNNNIKFEEDLTKFLLCGKAPFKLVSNYFSTAQCEEICGNQWIFEIKKSNKTREKYAIDINQKSAPFLMVFNKSNFPRLVIVDYRTDKNYIQIFLSKCYSCRELKFIDLSFNNAFNKNICKNNFAHIEIIKIIGTFNNFKFHCRKAFKEFIFNSFPNLKEIDITFRRTKGCSKLNIDDINESVKEEFIFEEKPPNFLKGTIKFVVDLLNSKDFNIVLTELNQPFSRFHYSQKSESIKKNIFETENLKIYFIFQIF